MRAWSRFVLRHHRAVLALWATAVVAALPAASRLQARLSDGGYAAPGSEAARAERVSTAEIGSGGRRQRLYLVVTAPGGEHGTLAARVREARQAVRRDPLVTLPAPPRVSSDSSTALVPLDYEGSFDDARRQLEHLRRLLAPVRGAQLSGQAAIVDASTRLATADLARAERISLPVTLAILLVAFLSLVAASLPIVLALAALALSFAAVLGVTYLTATSVFVVNTAILLGVGLGIDYSLFVVSRYREARRTGLAVDDAIETTLATTGRAILFSGVTVGVALVGLLVFGVGLFTSMAIGAALAAFIAAAASLSLLPAILRSLGPRIDALTIARMPVLAERARLWNWLAGVLVHRRASVAAITAGALLLLSAPLLTLRITFPSTTTLLPGSSDPTAAVTARVERRFGPGALTPFTVLTRAAPRRVAAVVDRDPGVAATLPASEGRDGWSAILAVARAEDDTPAANATLARLRGTLHREFPGTLVGGRTAEGQDLVERVSARFPLFVAAAAALTLVLLFAAFRSVAVPVKAVVTNLLTVGATLGLLTVAYQWLGSSPGIAFFVPVFLFAVLFGLSMDYEVFLISRIRDEHLAGAAADDSVVRGLVASARPITLAAVAMITVFASSATSELEPFRQLGVGISVAVLIDATVVRCLLVPAAMLLLGRWNWWAPAWLSRMPLRHRRAAGLREGAR